MMGSLPITASPPPPRGFPRSLQVKRVLAHREDEIDARSMGPIEVQYRLLEKYDDDKSGALEYPEFERLPKSPTRACMTVFGESRA